MSRSAEPRSLSRSDPRHVVERYLDEALNGSAPAELEELIGSETLRQKLSAFRAAFPDLVVATQLLVADGPYVAVHLTGRGTHRGMFMGVPATGRSWAASCSALYRVEDGKIVDCWVNWDALGILEQIGGVRRIETASA